MEWNELLSRCEYYIASDLARPMNSTAHLNNRDINAWADRTALALPQAREVILKMNNLELIDLIGKVIGRNA